ncbi:MAG: hypothetical protein K9J85_09695 [Desulfobacteraceae bacterium]|nr:hypothetical protein [Desulfobacteraceae bacterium]
MNQDRKNHSDSPSTEGNEDGNDFEPSIDGMSDSTARLAMDKNLRKKLQHDYDVQSIENRGHYFAAKVTSKDGRTVYELLINKHTGDVQVVSQKDR